MPEYVLDTSILIQGFIVDTYSPRVKTLLLSVYDNPPTILHILNFGLVESANILWKQVAFQNVPLLDARSHLAKLEATPLMAHSEAIYLDRALEIAAQYHLSVYDSLLLALAEDFGLSLITSDFKQAGIAARMGLIVKPITDFVEYQP